MNISDSERLAAFLEQEGFKSLPNQNKANVVVINTCGVKQGAEDRVYGLVNVIRLRNPKSIIVITGCLSERPDVQRRLKTKVDIWLKTADMATLLDRIRKIDKTKFRVELKDYLKIKPKYNSAFSAFVPIGNGCNNFCSYCVVPYARGRETYRPAKEIMAEVKTLLKKGYKEINLIAQNVNSYRDLKSGLDFADLLKMVNDLPGNFWLRFSTSHPKDMTDKLIKAIGTCQKLCEHIHLPIQSGSDEILKRMNRSYNSNRYRQLIKKIRLQNKYKKIPIAITTDIIVGFPGETKKQFKETVKLFKEISFDLAYISRYSPRYGTLSFKMKDNVSEEEKKKRDQELQLLLRKTALADNLWYQDKIIDVLVDHKDRQGIYLGKSRTFKTIKIMGSESGKDDLKVKKNNSDVKKQNNILGQIVKVKIVRVRDFGLEGLLMA